MRTIPVLGLLLLLAAGAFGQHRGAGAGRGFHGFAGRGIRPGIAHGGFAPWRVPFRTYGSRHGFGNVIFPGVGTAPPFGRAFGYYRRPFGPHYRYRFYRPWPYRFWGYPWMAPLAFPVFVGGYAWPDPPAPNVIVINQEGDPENRPPQARDEKEDPVESGHIRYEPPGRAVELRSGVDEEAIYQILFKDRSAAPVVAHWVDEDTLHYVTSQGAHWLVPLDSVDRALTEQFNRAKKIEFR